MKKLPPQVAAVAQLRLIGNITPRRWYTELTFPNGQPDFAAITVLSEILYQYKPFEIFDKKGELIGWGKKFRGEKWQCSSDHFKRFGLGKDQTLDATKRLAARGLIIREIESKIVINGRCYNNVMFIIPVVEKIAEISFENVDLTDEIYTLSAVADTLPAVADTLPAVADTLPAVADTLPATADRNTTTTQLLKNTTTTTPASCSGSSFENLEWNKIEAHEKQALIKILEGLRDKSQAQQILDELADNISAGTVKKSKRALLTALVNKANRGEFQPTSERGEIRARRAAQEQARKADQKRQQEEIKKMKGKHITESAKAGREAARRAAGLKPREE